MQLSLQSPLSHSNRLSLNKEASHFVTLTVSQPYLLSDTEKKKDFQLRHAKTTTATSKESDFQTINIENHKISVLVTH